MKVTYGFAATLTARPGMAGELVDVLLSGLAEGAPAASEHCHVYLVSQSASDPNRIHVTEGWSSEEDHHRVFAGDAAAAIVARIAGLVEDGDEPYTDFVPVGGKARF